MIKVKSLFLILWLMIFLSLPGLKQISAADDEIENVIQVNTFDGSLSVDIGGMPLMSVLEEIGDKAGFKVVGVRYDDIQIQKSFENVPLDKAIRRIMGDLPTVILYQASQAPERRKNLQGIIAVWVFHSQGIGSVFNNLSGLFDLDLTSEEAFWVDRLVDAPEPGERQEAITSLVDIGSKVSVATVFVAFQDKDAKVRESVVKGLKDAGTPGAETMLFWALKNDEEPLVRLAALRALGEKKSHTTYAYLNAALADKDARVREAAEEMMREIEKELGSSELAD